MVEAGDSTTTTTVLLEGLMHSGNQGAWAAFDQRYRPIILGLARRLGLDESDAADVAQETCICFIRDFQAGKYDRQRGRLRAWLMTIARYRTADLKRKKAQRREQRGGSAFVDLPKDDELERIWEEERLRALRTQSFAQLRQDTKFNERTIQAFELYVVQGRPAVDVAHELNMTSQDVYTAKNRIAERLREIMSNLDELYNDG
ncbi:MAG: sigma-70 family RNA polymerase sigma factor [Phycisphaerales bacterium]|nr:sigma-70 family RNA polymerase sigma factor [Phycisphaerales bacterium]